MKEHKQNRGERRNAYITPRARATRFDGWMAWVHANVTAKLAERREQCRQARIAVADAIVNAASIFQGLPRQEIVRKALLKFWNGERRTRVVHRIRTELAHA